MNRELEVGMYIRYVPTLGDYTQKISKITKIKNCLLDMAYYLDNEKEPVFSSHFDDILKSSYNPIDLIEVGDYVNGVEVEEINDKEIMLVDTHLWIDKEVANRLIESIVTKEQFEEMKYIIEK